ncbi:tRNA lysidine(34) synthetase TilS [Ruegeria arenilitoris]|uniref:tRNA lysidine(34) synthetase TilS n=1 Tax=Ruegeria arenilitoris TaxID=1173585 RepID=UPI003F5CE4BD
MFLNANAQNLLEKIEALLPDPLPRRLGVAVSGGSDSTALLRLLSKIAPTKGIELFAATVDHGLRKESADEAALVGEFAQRWGVPHTILKWQGWDGSGNLQDQARRARYGLLLQWAQERGLGAIALGHNADDQAETVLMRLARAAGVSGLSAMAAVRREGDIDILRPLLSVTRTQLRDYLNTEGIDWIDDPSNQDPRFDRIKVREALTQLDEIGLTAETLTRVAENLARAREALQQYTQDSARKVVHEIDGVLCLDQDDFQSLPDEIRRRIIVAAVGWIAGQGYPPRQTAIDQTMKAISAGKSATLGGCLLTPEGKKIWISRELRAVRDQVADPGDLWDNRWIVTGPQDAGAEIRALGEEGVAQLENWRDLGRPKATLLSSPAVWSGDTILSAPLAGHASGWHIQMAANRPEFYASILSH